MFPQLFLLLALLLSVSAQTCIPEQARLLLGDRYADRDPVKSIKNSATLIFHTKGNCQLSYVDITDGTSQFTIKSTNITHSYYNNVDFCHNGKKCVKVTYDQHIHTIQLNVTTGVFFQYTIYGSSLGLIPISLGPFQGLLPQVTNAQNVLQRHLVMADWSDSGDGVTTFGALDQMFNQNQRFDTMIFAGDYAYEFYSNNGKVGDDFLSHLQKYDTRWPLMISAGNHQDNFNFTFFNEKFRFPNYDQTKNNYYSYNIGPVHFIALNLHYYDNETAIDSDAQARMLSWLEQDLQVANLDRQIRPWIIAFSHKPIYCLNSSECPNFYGFYAAFDQIFNQYKVDIFIAAHKHQAQYMGPMYKNQMCPSNTDITGNIVTNPSCTIHLLQGNAGCMKQSLIEASLQRQERFTTQQFFTERIGFGIMTIHNSTHVHYEFQDSSDLSNMYDQYFVKSIANEEQDEGLKQEQGFLKQSSQ